MKANYPKLLPWLANNAGIPMARAEELWIEALRQATRDSSHIESSHYWQSALQHLRAKLAAESRARRAAPFGWGSLLRLPARQWLHGLVTLEALTTVSLRSTRAFRQRPC